MSWQKDEEEALNPRTYPGFSGHSFNFIIKAGLLLISASSIAFEIDLTRLFSVAQFYHFAFMIVSTVLLGSAASGIALSIYPNLGQNNPKRFLSWAALCASLSTTVAYVLFNLLPFDSFSISWDIRQGGILILHYLLLSLPFFFCGLVVSFLLNSFPDKTGSVYGVNLAGSSVGCLLALALPGSLGGDGLVLFCSGFAALSTLGFSAQFLKKSHSKNPKNESWIFDFLPVLLAGVIIILSGIDMGARLSDRAGFSWSALKISPYKSLSHILQFPDVKTISEKWNSFSRVDMVESSAIRSLPGLSYRYQQSPPAEYGLFVDGDDLSPVLISAGNDDFSAYLPTTVAFKLRPGAKTLVLEPRGGLDIISALAQGACCVTAVEQNPLIVSAAEAIYSHPKVDPIIEFERSYLKRNDEQFDIIQISLISAYHPIQSGAYSLAEDYRYTVEALGDSIKHLNPGGILVLMRWLQDPPSEDLRAFALAVEAVEQAGGDATQQIVAFRGYNTTTMMIKREAFTSAELSTIRGFLNKRAFDISYAPDVRVEETNQYNILPKSIYYETYMELIHTGDRSAFYKQYPYDVSPSTDDHPFMGHYFKGSQVRQIMAEWGKTWQPFGGAGYLVIIGLLIMTMIIGSALVLFPWMVRKIFQKRNNNLAWQYHPPIGFHFGFFASIGFAYLLVEIPLIQKFILFLGQPAYAFAIVLFAILFFSGCGSLISHKISLPYCLIGIAFLVLIFPIISHLIFEKTLGLPVGWRMTIAVLMVAPLGIFMGIPFPAGLRWIIQKGYADQITWYWGINGAASVISAILAAMLALSFGFAWVLRIGAVAYFVGWLMVILESRLIGRTTLHR